MNKDKKALWVAALRSGKYAQGRGLLHHVEGVELHCCLGVLSALAAQDCASERTYDQPENRYAYDGHSRVLSDSVMEWAELESSDPCVYVGETSFSSLAVLNDTGSSFAKIADLIEAQL